MSWYRVYRPQTIAELHLSAVRESLSAVRISGQFSHAYLFAGPKGTGKTSSARILAKLLNCVKNRDGVEAVLAGKKTKKELAEPCGSCESCVKITQGTSFNVTEMDAASNRGIDDIRALRERIALAPTGGPVAVYIIDEAHMLTTEAFNALLKILEEPPAHVVFILATTEPQKIPATVTSRCTVIRYSKASMEELLDALLGVVKKESLKLSKNTLRGIAERAEGSFRDAIKLLETIASSGEEKQSLSSSESQKADALLMAILEKDARKVGELFRGFGEEGNDVAFVQRTLLAKLHTSFLKAIEHDDPDEVRVYGRLLRDLNQPVDPLLPVPHLPFELACFRLSLQGGSAGSRDAGESKRGDSGVAGGGREVETKRQNAEPKKPATKKSAELQEGAIDKKSEELAIPDPQTNVKLDDLLSTWQEILRQVKPSNASVEALLRAARPHDSQKERVVIEVFYPFHKEQLEQNKHRMLVEDVMSKVLGVPRIHVAFVLGTKPPKTDTAKPTIEDTQLAKAAEEAFL